jgi:hypothetical protein
MVKPRKRRDWSRPLPQPLQILDENEKPIITLKTLGDVRKMLSGLPEPYPLKTTWGHVAVMLDEAARGGDIMDVVVPLRRCWGGDRVPAALILHRGHVADDRQSCRLHAPGSLR